MVDFEAPSFSLGLDFELDSQPNFTAAPEFQPAQSLRTIAEEEDGDDFDSLVSGPDLKCSDPPLPLKRLVRGSAACKSTSAARSRSVKEGTLCELEDDEIEDFSSQEDPPEDRSKSIRSVSSSSKIPLHHHGGFSMQSATQCTLKGKNMDTDSPAFQNKEPSDTIFVFSKLDVSPLRRFEIIDSDDPSTTEHLKKGVKVKAAAEECALSSKQMRDETSHVTFQSEDLWKGFLTDEKFHISTPALDEVCEEYFRSLTDRNAAVQNANEDDHRKSSLTENCNMQQRHNSSLVPAHSYFFHKELRIQKLVRDRLPHFFPLGAKSGQGVKQNDGSINYIGQFAPRGGPESRTNKVAAEAISTKRRKKDSPKEASEASISWVNPKDSAVVAKDAGKRRVHAVGNSAGHWLTASDGKRVYITRNGEELSGRNAYMLYRKESGSGFNKSKSNTTGNKKSFAKRKKR
ncbi:hypothetical protein DM860_000572 [Cuscuta australis]|uniref:Uncharacterized protein n=1 Tax=Cuscuta australis TaxID=267555 RepID=A0A328CZP4_9ASTE|nr:hypothetical protein DM860_000572 [Cuscuta australis]